MAKLSLYYPVKPKFVNQGFGVTDNTEYYQSNGINIIGHNGIDFQAKHGQPVYATHDGISYTEVDENQGHGVVLITNQKFDYLDGQAFYKTIYWHLVAETQPNVWGKQIKAGDLIGYADSTGLSTGDHLHFGLKPVANNEPDFTWINIAQDNGYMGAINPNPYFNGLFAEDILHPHTFNTNLHFGMDNQEVILLQAALRKLGYFTYPSNTGFYGQVTKDAVLKFQLDKGVISSGIETVFGYFFGPKSCDALNKALAGS